MLHPATMPTVALLAIFGAAAGVELGRASVDEINPVHFADPEPTFYADLIPHKSAPSAVQPASVSDPVPGYAEYGTGCLKCAARRADDHSGVDGIPDGYAASAWDGGDALEIEVVVIGPEPNPALAEVERYAHYPVTAEEGASTAIQHASTEPGQVADD